jgi:hypothetical protein
MFCLRKAIFIRLFLKRLVILLTSLPKLVKVSLFYCCCAGGSVCMFYFCGGGFSNRFALYSLFCSTVYMMFISASFALIYCVCMYSI